MAQLNILDELNAVGAIQRNIHDGHIRFQRFNSLQRLRGILGLPTNHQIWFPIDELGQPFNHHGMVVNHENPFFVVLSLMGHGSFVITVSLSVFSKWLESTANALYLLVLVRPLTVLSIEYYILSLFLDSS